MDGWRLTDGRDPADSPEEFPTVLITSESQLRQELERLRRMSPAIVSLSNPGHGALQIGLGGPFAGLRWFVEPFSSPRIREILADRSYCSSRMDFSAEGDTIAFSPDLLMPVEQAIEIAV